LWRKILDRGFKVHTFEGTFHENTGRRLQFLVGVYGDVYKSCGGVGSGKKELCVGNLDSDGNLNYNFVYYQYQAYDPFADPKCRDCNVLPICQGKIDPLGYGDDGMMYQGDCASFKELFAGTLLAYMEQAYPHALG
jgi:radical SAM protein with 4Fe4S-binding SPASM domain